MFSHSRAIAIDREKAELVLSSVFGFNKFREQQYSAIEAALQGRDTLLVAATGSGKSLVYQFPTQYLRAGPRAGQRSTTIVISPLLSLMEDQAMAMRAIGVSCIALHGETANSSEEWLKAMAGGYDLVFTTPESAISHLNSLSQMHARGLVDVLAIDEAHTVSEWGVDFRPDFRRLSLLRDALPGVPILALTATATPRVRDDIVAVLQMSYPVRITATFNRPNLHYTVAMKTNLAEDIARALRSHGGEGSTIIYVNTQKEAEALAQLINNLRIAVARPSSSSSSSSSSAATAAAPTLTAAPYHAGLPHAQRMDTHKRFMLDELRVIVATSAFGMGIDKRDVRCVVNYGCPKTLETYYQMSGRAGRDGDPSFSILLWSHSDFTTLSFLQASNSSSSSAASGPSIADVGFDAIKKFVLATGGCRRKQVLEYLGEALGGPCTGCDNCDRHAAAAAAAAAASGSSSSSGPALHDFTADCRSLLQALAFCGPNVGQSRPIEIVTGNRSAKLLGQYPLERQQRERCYGAGAGKPDRYWQGILRILLERSLVELRTNSLEIPRGGGRGGGSRQYTSYPVTQSGRTFAAPSSSVSIPPMLIPADLAPYMTKRSSSSSSSSSPGGVGLGGGGSAALVLTPAEQSVYDAMSDVRRSIAEGDNVPTFIVCSNAALRSLVHSRPVDQEALHSLVEGFGAIKAAKYGPKLLPALAQACARFGLELGRSSAPASPAAAATAAAASSAASSPAPSRLAASSSQSSSGSGGANIASLLRMPSSSTSAPSSSSSGPTAAAAAAAAAAPAHLGPVDIGHACALFGITDTKREAWERVMRCGASPTDAGAAMTQHKSTGVKPDTVVNYLTDCVEAGMLSAVIRGSSSSVFSAAAIPAVAALAAPFSFPAVHGRPSSSSSASAASSNFSSSSGGGDGGCYALDDYSALCDYVLISRCGASAEAVRALGPAINRAVASAFGGAELHWNPGITTPTAVAAAGGEGGGVPRVALLHLQAEEDAELLAPRADAPPLKLNDVMSHVQPESLRDFKTLKLMLTLCRVRHKHLGELHELRAARDSVAAAARSPASRGFSSSSSTASASPSAAAASSSASPSAAAVSSTASASPSAAAVSSSAAPAATAVAAAAAGAAPTLAAARGGPNFNLSSGAVDDGDIDDEYLLGLDFDSVVSSAAAAAAAAASSNKRGVDSSGSTPLSGQKHARTE